MGSTQGDWHLRSGNNGPMLSGTHPDAEFLGLVPASSNDAFRFRVENHLTRFDGRLYGGTAIAASMAASEQRTDQQCVWMTTQFVATAPANELITLRTEVMAAGHRTSQVRVTGTDSAGNVMFASLGATGIPRDGGVAGTYESVPRVSAVAESERTSNPFLSMLKHLGVSEPPPTPAVGMSTIVEYREAEVFEHPNAGPGRLCFWVRRVDSVPITAPISAYIADMVPLSIAEASQTLTAGTSLDNTMRVGRFEPSEWLLLDLRPTLASGDYGTGAALIWNQEGHLVASASQTASLTRIDLQHLPWENAD